MDTILHHLEVCSHRNRYLSGVIWPPVLSSIQDELCSLVLFASWVWLSTLLRSSLCEHVTLSLHTQLPCFSFLLSAFTFPSPPAPFSSHRLCVFASGFSGSIACYCSCSGFLSSSTQGERVGTQACVFTGQAALWEHSACRFMGFPCDLFAPVVGHSP